MPLTYLPEQDPAVADALRQELARERDSVELIASENFTSPAVLEAVGSVLTNKYAEGYPAQALLRRLREGRYRGGPRPRARLRPLRRGTTRTCSPTAARTRTWRAYEALIELGDTVLGMSLAEGGHLTHGSPVNFSGRHYHFASYGVDPETETIDYDEVERIAKEVRPKLIVGGASAYPRIIDFAAHGRHRTRGGRVLHGGHGPHRRPRGRGRAPEPRAATPTSSPPPPTRPCAARAAASSSANDEDIAKRVDKAVFPGSQGGPLMHVIAGKAVAFGEAAQPSYKEYIGHVVENAARLGQGMMDGGLRLVSGGTDNHLCLVDLTPADVTGKDAEKLLESVGITVNKNSIPNEPRSPFVTSGIRVGSAAATTRGFTAEDFYEVGQLIAATVFNAESDAKLADIRTKVDALLAAHPLYPELDY